MAGLLSIAYPLPTKQWAIRFEGKFSSGVELIDADTLTEAKRIARKRNKATKVWLWVSPYDKEQN